MTNVASGCRRALIVLGNGFSLDLLNDLNLGHEIKIACTDLIPTPSTIQFNPLPPHPQEFSGVFWRKDLWPRLHSMSSEGKGFWEICRHIAEQPLSSGREQRTAFFGNDDEIIAEFKFYLYYLFVEYGKYFLQSTADARSVGTTFWANFLKYFVCKYETSILTYNYDIFLDTVLNNIGCWTCDAVPNAYRQSLGKSLPSKNHIRIIRPHGSILLSYGSGIDYGGMPWLRHRYGLNYNHNTIVGTSWKFGFPPQGAPLIPDILPPGSSHARIGIGDWDALDAAKFLLSQSEVVLFIGFNGGNCDFDETCLLSSSTRPSSKVFSVMKQEDWLSSGVLRAYSSIYGDDFVHLITPDKRHELFDML